jgi:hypothetical protein
VASTMQPDACWCAAFSSLTDTQVAAGSHMLMEESRAWPERLRRDIFQNGSTMAFDGIAR